MCQLPFCFRGQSEDMITVAILILFASPRTCQNRSVPSKFIKVLTDQKKCQAVKLKQRPHFSFQNKRTQRSSTVETVPDCEPKDGDSGSWCGPHWPGGFGKPLGPHAPGSQKAHLQQEEFGLDDIMIRKMIKFHTPPFAPMQIL